MAKKNLCDMKLTNINL